MDAEVVGEESTEQAGPRTRGLEEEFDDVAELE